MAKIMNIRDKATKNLIEALVSIDDAETGKNFLLDLCTPSEIKALVDRLEVAKLIQEGESYRNIALKTQNSTATITRVGQALKYGKGGYLWALEATSES